MDRIGPDGKPVKFDIKFVTHDEKRGTGGDIVEIQGARKCVGKEKGKVIFDLREPSGEKSHRDPHHFVNSTRNLLLENGQVRKVHIRLILWFNGKKVCF